uniref:Uncharacterized protein n=1 Tax=Ditylenchus dipsaci TaxID=166011 RepID=A0A915D444_9BILA
MLCDHLHTCKFLAVHQLYFRPVANYYNNNANIIASYGLYGSPTKSYYTPSSYVNNYWPTLVYGNVHQVIANLPILPAIPVSTHIPGQEIITKIFSLFVIQ